MTELYASAQDGTERPFRFGVVCGAHDGRGWLDLARRVEALGYSVLLSSDHLDLGGAHFSELSAMPSLAAAAAVTETVRIGTSVINHDLHHPAVLAREAVSLDLISDGRFELGLGAGWAEYEYAWAGIPFDPVGRRITRFGEYADVIRALTTRPDPDDGSTAQVSHEGEFFTIDEMPLVPAPVQPRVPLMIGGTGRRMLSLAARQADVVSVNLNGPIPGSAAAMDERIGWIRAQAAGRERMPELNNIIGTLVMTDRDRRQALRDELARQRAAGNDFMTASLTEDELLESPIALIGSVASVAEDILSWRERWGISYVIVTYPELEAFAPVVARLAGR
jgi:probable F420-dependent oxidoreductase